MAMPPQSPPPRHEGSRLTPFLVAATILLLGAGAAVVIFLSGGGGGSSTTTVSETQAGEPAAGEEAPAEENGLPGVSKGEMEAEISTLLLDYHEDVVARDFRSAWALLSARKRQQDLGEYGYAKWMQAQSSLSNYLDPSGLQARIDGFEGEGVARVDVTGMGWSEPGSPCFEWVGLTWVKYERDIWTYDPGYSTTPARRRTWQPQLGRLLGANC